jgi:DNA-binding transcriptional ArsR family regulator
MPANITSLNLLEEKNSGLLALIGQPVRIQILLVIRAQEACVCHLEAVLGMRQASISQHLMVLRKAGLMTTHRVGRNIFYQLCRPEVVDVLKQTAQIAGIGDEALSSLAVRQEVIRFNTREVEVASKIEYPNSSSSGE